MRKWMKFTMPIEVDGVEYKWNLYRGFLFENGDTANVSGAGWFFLQPGTLASDIWNMHNAQQGRKCDGNGVVFYDLPEWANHSTRALWHQKLTTHRIRGQHAHLITYIGATTPEGTETCQLIMPVYPETLVPPGFDRKFFVKCSSRQNTLKIGHRSVSTQRLRFWKTSLYSILRAPENQDETFSIPAHCLKFGNQNCADWIQSDLIDI